LNNIESVVGMGFDLLISCVGMARHDGRQNTNQCFVFLQQVLQKINALDQLPFLFFDFDRIGLQNTTKGCLIQTQESGRWKRRGIVVIFVRHGGDRRGIRCR
jgi:hypothetical protein